MKKILKNPWIIGIGTAVISTLILYFIFGIGKNIPAIENNAPISSSIRTIDQSGGVNIINPTAETKLDYSTLSLNMLTSQTYTSSFYLVYFSPETINQKILHLQISKLLRCQKPVLVRAGDYIAGKYRGMKTIEYSITCTSTNKIPIDGSLELFKI